ncbi:sensor histidine kinase [Mucilaginibacter sp. dw_454]|uniref:sensor histidine kinase n=1 Tax=Mucilaginibacter sp. dw_454 TaxID=2720079 RepID=UPI001BD2D9D5|nr:sensor histidine kinase [Mucilaginibacter sp. dw_454]
MKKSWQIFWHVFVWVCIITFFLVIIQSSHVMPVKSMVVNIVLFGAINISIFYLNYLIFIPQFLNKKRFSVYIAAVVITIVVYGLAKYGVGSVFKEEVLMHTKGPNSIKTAPLGFWPFFLSTLFTSTIFVLLSILLKFSVDWFLNERIQRDLENQRLTAELAFLKSQINPHFLFNSLNSIYSLAYQQSENTPGAILKLSEIMRYMLYECNDNKVDLSKELQYLQNYIDLQKIRFGNKAYIDFKVDGQVADQKIVPLLLIAFIENAFKHGIANDATVPITLFINVNQQHLQFYIQNKKHTNNRDAIGGIGLSNVKRRLDLLYPGKYNLDIRDEIDTYTCELSLVL